MVVRARRGRYRHLVTFQQRTDAKSNVGQPIPTWADLGHGMASIQPFRGAENQQGSGDYAETTHKVFTEGRSDFTLVPNDRILFGARVFDVERVLNIDEVDREWEIWCKEVHSTIP